MKLVEVYIYSPSGPLLPCSREKVTLNITSYSHQATVWKVRGSNPGEGEIFRTPPDRPWGPPNLLCNGYRLSSSGVKRPGRGVDHPPSTSSQVEEILEIHLYSPLGLCCLFQGESYLQLYLWQLPAFRPNLSPSHGYHLVRTQSTLRHLSTVLYARCSTISLIPAVTSWTTQQHSSPWQRSVTHSRQAADYTIFRCGRNSFWRSSVMFTRCYTVTFNSTCRPIVYS